MNGTNCKSQTIESISGPGLLFGTKAPFCRIWSQFVQLLTQNKIHISNRFKRRLKENYQIFNSKLIVFKLSRWFTIKEFIRLGYWTWRLWANWAPASRPPRRFGGKLGPTLSYSNPCNFFSSITSWCCPYLFCCRCTFITWISESTLFWLPFLSIIW